MANAEPGPMRLALVAPANILHTVRWANSLAARDHTVDVFSLHAPSDALSDEVRVHWLRPRSPHGYFLAARGLRRRLHAARPDVVNAHYASGYGTLARLAGVRPLALSVWGSDVFEFPQRSRWHRRLLTGNLRAADRILSTSHAMAEAVQALTPEAPYPRVTPFGVDTERFAPPTSPRDDGRIVIGTVKTLAPAYGIDRLLRSFATLKARLAHAAPDTAQRLTLCIAGDGPDREQLAALADELGIAAAVTFSGRVPPAEVPAYLGGLDIFAALSRSESFGVAVLEASACGLPVVVSDAGGLPEVVDNGRTGHIVAGGEPTAAGEAMAKLATDTTRRERMGAAGRQWVLDHYGWSACAAAMEAAYAEVAGSRSSDETATT